MTKRASTWLVLAGVCAVLTAASGAGAASKPVEWRRIDLGTLGGKVAFSSSAAAINARGDVIGNSTNRAGDQSRAFFWRGGRLIPLGTLGGGSSWASGINDRGQVVGWAETRSGKTHAFLSENGRMSDLGVPAGSDASVAAGITNSGSVAGVAWSSGSPSPIRGHVIVWQNGRSRDLGVPWSPSRRGAATSVGAVNERGEIIGGSYDEYLSASGRVFLERAFFWDGSSLRTLPPRNARTEAIGISESGQVIGWTYRSDFRAATWKGGQMRLLPLPPGERGAFTSAINDRGEIIGYGWHEREADNHALLWRNGTVIDLDTLGGKQSEAAAINNRGQIVGRSETALNDSDGSPIWHPFVRQNDEMIDLGTANADPVAINQRGEIIGNSTSSPFYVKTHALVWLPD